MSEKTNLMLKCLIFGIVIGLVVSSTYFLMNPASESEMPTDVERKPLYWVAPMDPNYRKSEPGQSPMGMDLIPYYGDEASDEDSPGTVRISSDVINNLGVRIEPAKFVKVESTIKGVGLVKYDEDQLFHIHPRVEGWVEKLYIKSSGQPVVMNQPIYDIYSPELVNAQEELLLALTRKNTRLIKAAEDRLKSLQFSSEQVKQLKQSRVTQQRVTFYSPHQGVLENLKIREGFYVKPGDTLMSIGALEDVWIEVDVLEKQSAAVKLNQPVEMTLDYLPGRTWQGQVDFIYPTLDPMTRTLKIRLRFNNEDKVLKPNMYAQVKINTFGDLKVLVVPTEAVIRTGQSDRLVLALGAGKFKSIDVLLGQQFDQYIEIIEGVSAGDKIVSSAQFLIDSESSKSSDFKRMNRGIQVDSPMDHSNMDHSNMDHSKMGHSKQQEPEVDHSKMDHSKMHNTSQESQ